MKTKNSGKNKHLTLEQRKEIEACLDHGVTFKAIAGRIGKDPTTVSQGKSLSPKYNKNIHGVLHRALDMAVRLEYMLRNPTCACVIPRVVEKKEEPLDAPEQKKLFEVLRGEEFEALFLTDIFTCDPAN